MALKQHFQIVSPPMPTGVTWLINVLLELGIRTTPYGGDWQESPQRSWLTPSTVMENQLWHLPALHRQQQFDFDPALEVFWDHRLSFAQYPARKTLLFVRDLRDTAYSHLCRQLGLNTTPTDPDTLLSRLRQPEIWQSYFPPLFDLPAADTLAYFYGCWLQPATAGNLLVLRFEDSKRDPLTSVRQALAFFEVERPEAEIVAALAHSDLSRFQQIKQHMEQQTGIHKVINRKGAIHEWRQALSGPKLTAFLECFAGPPAWAQQALDYSVEPAAEAGVPALMLQRELQQQLQQNTFAQAWNSLQAQLSSADALLQPALANQWLALLWTRAILGPAQLELPSACALASRLASLNATFRLHPALQRAARLCLDPQHALHQFPAPSVWRADTSQPLAAAVAQAQAAGEAFVLWQLPGIQFTTPGLLQLLDLLDGRTPNLLAVLPTLIRPQSVTARQAWQAHACWGAEFQRVPLQALPPCILFCTEALARQPLEQPESAWLAGQNIHQALGVLAWETS